MTDPRSTRKHDISAEDARQGEIILRRRWQRIVFIAGLASFVLFILFGSLVYANGFLGAGLPGK